MFGETPFLRSSWPLKWVKVNSSYAKQKPTCDIIFQAIVPVYVYEIIMFNLSKWFVFEYMTFKSIIIIIIIIIIKMTIYSVP